MIQVSTIMIGDRDVVEIVCWLMMKPTTTVISAKTKSNWFKRKVLLLRWLHTQQWCTIYCSLTPVLLAILFCWSCCTINWSLNSYGWITLWNMEHLLISKPMTIFLLWHDHFRRFRSIQDWGDENGAPLSLNMHLRLWRKFSIIMVMWPQHY